LLKSTFTLVGPNSNWSTCQIRFHCGFNPQALWSSGSYVKMNMINLQSIGSVNKKHSSKSEIIYSQSLLMEQKTVKQLFRTIVGWRKAVIIDFAGSTVKICSHNSKHITLPHFVKIRGVCCGCILNKGSISQLSEWCIFELLVS
jgi:hypothetical protein